MLILFQFFLVVFFCSSTVLSYRPYTLLYSHGTNNKFSKFNVRRDGTLLGDWGELIKLREACPPEICLETTIATAIRRSVDLNLIHWLHPIIMSSIVISLAGAGVYYSKQIIQSRGENSNGSQTSADSKAKSLHPTIMSVLLFFMIIGTQSGLSSMLVLQQPLIESPHAVTAIAATVTLTVQAVLGSLIDTIPSIRNVHRYFGLVTLIVLAAHLVTGLSLGLSIDV